MSVNPSLFLRRLVVMGHNDIKFYDQSFQKGLNVIFGENSSGKTTILDFIYYALGGNVKSWRDEALECSYVAAELEINGDVMTVRRDIDRQKTEQRPTLVAWNDLNSAFSSGGAQWQEFKYASQNSLTSFSQLLLKALQIPECKYGTSERASLCTMHNILRLLHVDQLTPLGRIFQVDSWDSYDRRETISDLLIGAYSDKLYSIKTALRSLREKEKDLKKEKQLYEKAAAKLNSLLNPDQIETAKQKLIKKRNKLYRDLEAKKKITRLTVSKKTEDEKKLAQLSEIQAQLNKHQSELNQAKLELVDTELFLKSLKEKKEALLQSEGFRELLSKVSFDHCPCCMNKLPLPKEGVCSLCNQPFPQLDRNVGLSRFRFEIDQQIINAKVLLDDDKEKILKLESKLTAGKLERAKIQKHVNSFARNMTDRDKSYDNLLLELGSIDEQISQLEKDNELSQRYQTIRSYLDEVCCEIKELQAKEANYETQAKNRRKKALVSIQANIQAIIDQDSADTDLKKKKGVRVSFKEDAIFVGERSNFAASSMHYLRIAFPIAFLESAAAAPQFNHPLLTVIDSIEDKGLEKERIYALQRYMKKFAEKDGKNTQIIFTTSDLLQELQGTKVQRGPHWTKEKHTLNFEGI